MNECARVCCGKWSYYSTKQDNNIVIHQGLIEGRKSCLSFSFFLCLYIKNVRLLKNHEFVELDDLIKWARELIQSIDNWSCFSYRFEESCLLNFP
jgi:hypothetical protein